jgi:signal transduction histidine kinase/DNA-binding response OmpR family regulator
MDQQFNTRILVIDDDENVRSSFREILRPSNSGKDESFRLETIENALFGESRSYPVNQKRSSATFSFEFDEASNGKDGYEAVKQAIADEKPYAAVFVDMRMPGWDGIETAQHLREIDTRVEIIFVTAYSDYSIDEIVTAVGTNVSYHCKPFSVEEIEQIATKAVYEWNKTRNLEELIKTISKLRGQHWEMDTLLNNILLQVAYLLGTHSALIAMKKNSHYEKIIAIGNLCDEKISEKYMHHIPADIRDEIYQNDEFAYFVVDEFGIIAIFEKGGKPLNNERVYIVRLFLEQAAQAIRNVDLQEALIQKEKLSAVGEATSVIVHDLKNSIGSIELAIGMIEEEIDNRKFVTEMLENIRQAARGGMAFVMDILDFTGNKAIACTTFQVDEMLKELENKSAIYLQKLNIKLAIECQPGLSIFADRNKLYRCIANIIKNAIEAFEGKEIANPEIKLALTSDKHNIHITISDNGPGIPDAIADKIFTPFVTYGKRRGTGLGLAIAKQIVEAHNGTIAIVPSEQGVAFNITLPGQPAGT